MQGHLVERRQRGRPHEPDGRDHESISRDRESRDHVVVRGARHHGSAASGVGDDGGADSRYTHQERLLLHQGSPAQAAHPPQWIHVEEDEGGRERERAPFRQDRRGEAGGAYDHAAAARGPRTLDRPKIRQGRQQDEHRTEQVGAAGDPGYGLDALWNDDFHHSARVALTGRAEAYYSDTLDAKRMQAEHECGDHGARAEDALALPVSVHADRGGEQSPGHEVEEAHIDAMEQHVQEVIAPRVHSPEEVVQAEGEPGERDVVPEEHAREGPADRRDADAAIAGVLAEVHVVVPVEERSGQGGQETRGGQGAHGDGREHAPDHGLTGARPAVSPSRTRDAYDSRTMRRHVWAMICRSSDGSCREYADHHRGADRPRRHASRGQLARAVPGGSSRMRSPAGDCDMASDRWTVTSVSGGPARGVWSPSPRAVSSSSFRFCRFSSLRSPTYRSISPRFGCSTRPSPIQTAPIGSSG